MDGVPGELIAVPGPRPTPAAIAVTVAVVEEVSPPSELLLATLAREAIEVVLWPLARVLDTPAEGCGVLIVWSPGGLDGIEVERVVAWSQGRTPPPGVIGWAIQGSAASTEHALRAGFDDVIAESCSPRELAVRIRALHRRVYRTVTRSPGRVATRMRYRNIVLDPHSCELWIDGRAVALTVTELMMVVALVRARGSVLTRTELLEQAWGGSGLEVSERAVDNVVLRLRRKLGRPELVETVRGVGFRLGLDDDQGDGGA